MSSRYALYELGYPYDTMDYTMRALFYRIANLENKP
jgi:hypothetical protein